VPPAFNRRFSLSNFTAGDEYVHVPTISSVDTLSVLNTLESTPLRRLLNPLVVLLDEELDELDVVEVVDDAAEESAPRTDFNVELCACADITPSRATVNKIQIFFITNVLF
jgi:hypothetical protein